MSGLASNGTRTAPRRVRWIAGAIGGSLLVIGALAWRARATGKDHPTRAATASTPAMAEMPGMAAPGGGASGDMPGGVRLDADQIRKFGVTFGVAERRELTNEIRAVGVVTVDSSRLVQVTPRFAGYVERLYVTASGQRVARGQPLMDVYSPDLVAAEQELLVAADLQRSMGQTDVPGVPAGGGSDLVAAARRRLSLWGISDAQITAVVRSGQVRRALTLFAPASGFVLDKNVVQGQAIQPGQTLYTIADLANVWVDAQLREMDATLVKPGAVASVAAPGASGEPLTGRVTYLYPTLDAQARTLRARVNLANATGRLKPGMYATVTLTSPARTALTVPASAVIRTGERDIVFVDAGNGELRPQDVRLGRTAADLTEIVSGIEPGQRVATSAQFLLDAESNLGDVMRSMIVQGGAGTTGGMAGTDMSGSMTDRGADTRGMPSMVPASPHTPRR